MSKTIAWGASKLLKMYLAENATRNSFEYCIDEFSKAPAIYDIPIKRSDALKSEARGQVRIVIFAVSSTALQQISSSLSKMGFSYGKDFIYYSDFFLENFERKAGAHLSLKLSRRLYQASLAYTLNSTIPIHTTILGTWLFLEILRELDGKEGAIAEIGAFQGGNALCALTLSTHLRKKRYYIFDSFEGFPELSKFDPGAMRKGDYAIGNTLQEVRNTFAIFPEAEVIEGFVPATFDRLDANEKFSCVFYDCDLYQPALDTFSYCWDRIVSGGYLVIHDFEAPENGYTGVKKATEEYFGPKGIKWVSFFENTMAIIQKP